MNSKCEPRQSVLSNKIVSFGENSVTIQDRTVLK